jgi:hypothetical protein
MLVPLIILCGNVSWLNPWLIKEFSDALATALLWPCL